MIGSTGVEMSWWTYRLPAACRVRWTWLASGLRCADRAIAAMALANATATHLALTVQPDRLQLLPGPPVDLLAYRADRAR